MKKKSRTRSQGGGESSDALPIKKWSWEGNLRGLATNQLSFFFSSSFMQTFFYSFCFIYLFFFTKRVELKPMHVPGKTTISCSMVLHCTSTQDMLPYGTSLFFLKADVLVHGLCSFNYRSLIIQPSLQEIYCTSSWL